MTNELLILWFLSVLQPAILLCSSTGSYRMCQHPEGRVAFLNGLKTKITFRIYSNDSHFNSDLRLQARIDSSTITDEYIHIGDDYVVIYNTCGDSNDPGLFCKEAQVTFLGENVTHNIVSFHLYSTTTFQHVKQLSNLTLEQATEGTTNPTTDTTSSFGTSQPGYTAAVTNESDLYTVIGVVAFILVASLIVISTLLVALILTTKKLKSNSVTPENGNSEETESDKQV